MTEFEKHYYKTWETIIVKPKVLARVIKQCLPHVKEFSEKEVSEFIHDIVLNDCKERYYRPKLTYDFKCNVDLPNRGQLKIFIYIYLKEEGEDITFLNQLNECKLIKEVDISDDNIIGICPIWIVDNLIRGLN